MRKLANKQEKQDPKSRMENEAHFSLWVFDSDFQGVSIFRISLLSTKQDFYSF